MCRECVRSGQKPLLEGLAAGVLVIEEAGEVLSAHVLTSLTHATKHLIMIGDHQQVRS